MPCQKCGSERLAVLSTKSSDRNFISIINGPEEDGYVPGDMGIGGGDYIEFEWCLNCGTIQGTWPLATTKLEGGNEDDDEDYDGL